MKVLHIASAMASDWGGIERYVSTLANASTSFDDVVIAAPIGSPIARQTKVETLPIRLTRKFDVRAFVVYRNLFRDRNFDVIVTHYSPDFVCAALAARGKRVKARILTRHVVIPFVSHRTELYKKLYEGFIGVSSAAAGALVASGIDHEKVRAVHGGCEQLVSTESLREQFLRPGVNVGTFGRLVPEKGIDAIVRARDLATQPWNLHIFGDGRSRKRLETSTQRDDIFFHGHVSDVGSAMSAMDIVAMPSRWSEAFSIAALEALSLGKPIVASCVGGLPELFTQGSPGKLVDPGNVRALAGALDCYVEQPSSLRRDGEFALKLYQSNYTPEKMAQRLRDAYLSFMD